MNSHRCTIILFLLLCRIRASKSTKQPTANGQRPTTPSSPWPPPPEMAPFVVLDVIVVLACYPTLLAGHPCRCCHLVAIVLTVVFLAIIVVLARCRCHPCPLSSSSLPFLFLLLLVDCCLWAPPSIAANVFVVVFLAVVVILARCCCRPHPLLLSSLPFFPLPLLVDCCLWAPPLIAAEVFVVYAFPLQWAGLKPSKRSDGKARFITIIAAPPEHFKGFRPAHCWGKAYLLAWGIVPHWSNASYQFFGL